jgi:hypothetical protein
MNKLYGGGGACGTGCSWRPVCTVGVQGKVYRRNAWIDRGGRTKRSARTKPSGRPKRSGRPTISGTPRKSGGPKISGTRKLVGRPKVSERYKQSGLRSEDDHHLDHRWKRHLGDSEWKCRSCRNQVV